MNTDEAVEALFSEIFEECFSHEENELVSEEAFINAVETFLADD